MKFLSFLLMCIVIITITFQVDTNGTSISHNQSVLLKNLPPVHQILLADTLANSSNAQHPKESRFVLIGSEARKKGKLNIVAVPGENFKKAYQIQSFQASTHNWDIQLTHKIPVATTKGEVVLASFAARSVPAPDLPASSENQQAAILSFTFEKASAPFGKSLNRILTVGSKWKYYYLPFKIRKSFAPNQTHVTFHLGFQRQNVQIADIRIVSYGVNAAINQFPNTPISYIGESADAAWRKKAKERIDRYRKSNLTVSVINHSGQPAANAKVHIAMQRHAFGFGTVINLNTFFAKSQNAKIYRQKIAKLFNCAVFGNAFKWNHYGEKPNRTPQRIEQALTWCKAHHIPVRGHNLVWPDWRHMHGLKKLADQPKILNAKISEHVRAMTTRWRGQLIGWDVVNEPYEANAILHVLGKGAIGNWYRIAHAGDPKATLFLNEHGIVSTPGWSLHNQAYFDLVRRLQSQHVPIGGIGIQGHIGTYLTPPAKLFQKLSRYARLDLPIKITEFDISFVPEQVRADYTRDFYTIAFSQPNVKAILMWGFWAGKDWRPKAALFNVDWTQRANFHAWYNLVFKKWWTDKTLTTNTNGKAEIRGFHGLYRVTVTTDGHTVSRKISLGKHNKNILIKLEG